MVNRLVIIDGKEGAVGRGSWLFFSTLLFMICTEIRSFMHNNRVG